MATSIPADRDELRIVERIAGDALVPALAQLLIAIDERARIRYASPSAGEFGLDRRSLPGRPLIDLVDPPDRSTLLRLVVSASTTPGQPVRGRLRLRTEQGVRVVSVVIDDRTDHPELGRVLVHGWDVTPEYLEISRLRERAFRDPLTGLANRELFRDRLDLELHRALRTGCPLAVLYGDVTDLKLVNDTLGHAAGDALLAEIGRRLSRHVRPSDTAARIGGDEFAVLCPDLPDGDAGHALADRLTEAMLEPLCLGDVQASIRLPLGVALAGDDDHLDGGSRLLDRADRAMYQAKRRATHRERAPR